MARILHICGNDVTKESVQRVLADRELPDEIHVVQVGDELPEGTFNVCHIQAVALFRQKELSWFQNALDRITPGE